MRTWVHPRKSLWFMFHVRFRMWLLRGEIPGGSLSYRNPPKHVAPVLRSLHNTHRHPPGKIREGPEQINPGARLSRFWKRELTHFDVSFWFTCSCDCDRSSKPKDTAHGLLLAWLKTGCLVGHPPVMMGPRLMSSNFPGKLCQGDYFSGTSTETCFCLGDFTTSFFSCFYQLSSRHVFEKL